MRRFFVLIILLVVCPTRSFSENKHDTLSVILNQHVKLGSVDYKSLCKDIRFDQYLGQLKSFDPNTLQGDKEKLAFWINAYNSWTLKIICDNYPLKSINELHSGGLALGMLLKNTVWDKKLVIINNEKTSLSHIEHKIIRPVFKDPRIHFAIVCAAKGCPPLRDEAYEADNLDKQLDDQGRIFISQEEKNSFNFESKTAVISPIFGWFKEDFGRRPESVLRFIARYLPEEEGKILSQDAARWRIKYTFYNWSLNEQ
ncbi:MAG: DUF547 domain-containing protein [Candidatus Omnitrophica bacterium]|nr:DUF547 domain-containing protein [Candidatus Omnitrophota bacterium]